jgi:hypothetical protein
VRRSFVPVALAAALLGCVPAAWANVGPGPAPIRALPGALVWGSGVFTSRAKFGRWLHDRHQTLAGWSKSHPHAAAILVFAEAPPIHFAPWQLAPRSSPPPVLEAIPAGSDTFPIVAIFGALGLSLVVLAALPFPLLAPRWGPGALVHHNRLAILAAGTTLVVAIVVAKLAA